MGAGAAAERWEPAAEAARDAGAAEADVKRWARAGLLRSRRLGRVPAFEVAEASRLKATLAGAPSEAPHKVLCGDGSNLPFCGVLPAAETLAACRCADLFSGAGGTALGLHNAGMSHVLLAEADADACATLRANSDAHGLGWRVEEGDVRSLSFEGLEAEVVQAGFPCQAFSHAGHRRGLEDARGTLFYEFARCVSVARPKLALGENVPGLATHDGGRTLRTMVSVLQGLGYRVAWRVLRAQFLDVPQKRERLIIVAVREDVAAPILFPAEQGRVVPLREALAGVPASDGAAYPASKARVLAQVPAGGNWRDLPEAEARAYMGPSFESGGGRTGTARRLSWNEPAPTLTCSPAQKQTERCHPDETRPLTVREYARVQTFPDSWSFAGSATSQYRQIGNAVPPNLAWHVGRCALAMLGLAERTASMAEATPLPEA